MRGPSRDLAGYDRTAGAVNQEILTYQRVAALAAWFQTSLFLARCHTLLEELEPRLVSAVKKTRLISLILAVPW